ncbi:gas vesicle protein GvpJ [Streptomyces sp. NPDC002845]
MTVVPQQSGGSSGLYDILELILDRGLVIDVFVRVSVIGIEILRVDIRVVVASVDTYLRFAEACNRLDLEGRPRQTVGLADFAGEITGPDGRDRSDGAVTEAVRTVAGALEQAREEGRAEPRSGARASTAARRKEERE